MLFINARDLHKELHVGKDFSEWFKGRMSAFGAIPGVDYIPTKVPSTSKRGVRNKIEYLISPSIRDRLVEREQHKINGAIGFNEEPCLRTVEKVLGVVLTRQFNCCGYKIDGYDEENKVAYEIDEESHKSTTTYDRVRQSFIEKRLGCTFVRILLY